jgi:hypothetical protein
MCIPQIYDGIHTRRRRTSPRQLTTLCSISATVTAFGCVRRSRQARGHRWSPNQLAAQCCPTRQLLVLREGPRGRPRRRQARSDSLRQNCSAQGSCRVARSRARQAARGDPRQRRVRPYQRGVGCGSSGRLLCVQEFHDVVQHESNSARRERRGARLASKPVEPYS